MADPSGRRRRWHDNFRDAGRGLVRLVRLERHARFHAAMAVLVVLAAAALRVTAVEWALLVLCVGVVVAAEGFNTALEAFLDRQVPHVDPVVGGCKDMAAGAVLAVSLAAAAVGVIVFLPRVLSLFATLRH